MSEQKDRERAVYGLKEKNLAKTYIRLIPLGMRDPDAIRMLNWKRPTERNVCLSCYALAIPDLTASCHIEILWGLPYRTLRSDQQTLFCHRGLPHC